MEKNRKTSNQDIFSMSGHLTWEMIICSHSLMDKVNIEADNADDNTSNPCSQHAIQNTLGSMKRKKVMKE